MDQRAGNSVDRQRSRDPATRLEWLADEVLVRCPRCDARAVVTALPALPDSSRGAPHNRVTCDQCGFERTAALRSSRWGGPTDPFFGLPLWLQERCCGELLWAFNERHLDLLERFVAAKLRERANATYNVRSLVERLPAWMKAASNREVVLRSIAVLRERAAP